MTNYNYNPLAPVTINSFVTLLSEWDGENAHVLNVLTGMIMVLRKQGMSEQVDAILQQRQ
jgi:hypothetical protein